MGLPIYRHKELPRRFPVGAKYVVEGRGGEADGLRVIARYIVLPSGRRINVPPIFLADCRGCCLSAARPQRPPDPRAMLVSLAKNLRHGPEPAEPHHVD